MKIRSNVKAGGTNLQHNEKQTKSLTVKSGVKAGTAESEMQHNEKLASDKNSLMVKTGVKAGGSSYQHNEKLTSGDVSSIDQKKTISQKLRLSKETIRTVKTGVKAGGINTQHNEKLAGDGNATEQKKSFGRKLRLSKETIRELKSSELKLAGGGGRIAATGTNCETICGSNHNEKLANDLDSIEQKNSFAKKLRLSKETIRELKDGDLKQIAGGAIQTGPCSRRTECYSC